METKGQRQTTATFNTKSTILHHSSVAATTAPVGAAAATTHLSCPIVSCCFVPPFSGTPYRRIASHIYTIQQTRAVVVHKESEWIKFIIILYELELVDVSECCVHCATGNAHII